MLPKKYRLPSFQFASVKSHGQLLQSPLFGVLVSLSPREASGEVGPSRFGFIVSTKISNKATVRNRLRRLLSEALLPLLPHLPPGHDYLVLAKTKLINQPLDHIRQTFHAILTSSRH